MGDPSGLHEIGYMYDFGDYGVEKDPYKAREWYEKAADFGVSNSMCRLGNFYEFGGEYAVPKDIHKAMEWYKKAADLGDNEAMDDIAGLYQDDAEYNYGVFTDDYRKALEWYRKLIETSSDTTSYSFKKAQEQIPKLEEILRKTNG